MEFVAKSRNPRTPLMTKAKRPSPGNNSSHTSGLRKVPLRYLHRRCQQPRGKGGFEPGTTSVPARNGIFQDPASPFAVGARPPCQRKGRNFVLSSDNCCTRTGHESGLGCTWYSAGSGGAMVFPPLRPLVCLHFRTATKYSRRTRPYSYSRVEMGFLRHPSKEPWARYTSPSHSLFRLVLSHVLVTFRARSKVLLQCRSSLLK